MGFDLNNIAAAKDPLDWDFTKSLGDGVLGTIPEPSRDAVDAFKGHAKRILEDEGIDLSRFAPIAALGENPAPGEIIAAVAAVMPELEGDTLEKLQSAQLEAVIELCEAAGEGAPTREQIEALPARYQEAFVGWLSGKFADPTRLTPASPPSLATANGASATT